MNQTTFTTTLTTDELEASHQLYYNALRILIREEQAMEQIQRSVCWQRLSTLHQQLPHRYRDPIHLYFQIKRSITH
jgi:hypothetical protein